jgi:hypothetical protein
LILYFVVSLARAAPLRCHKQEKAKKSKQAQTAKHLHAEKKRCARCVCEEKLGTQKEFFFTQSRNELMLMTFSLGFVTERFEAFFFQLYFINPKRRGQLHTHFFSGTMGC